MIFAVSEEGISALNTTAYMIDEAVKSIVNTTQYVEFASDNYKDTLGPHKASLDAALEEISKAILDSTESADETSETLRGLAVSYAESIRKDGFQRVRRR